MKVARYVVASYTIILVIMCNVWMAHGQQEKTPEYFFYKGNSFYEEGEYGRAIEEYSKLTARGLESGHLYFNLGNSYFKKGELGKAILNYERAKRLIPRDSDLLSNHFFAISQIRLRPPEDVSWMSRLSGKLKLLNLNELAVITSFLFIAGILCLTATIYSRAARKYIFSALVIFITLACLFAASLYGRVSIIDKEAVILSENVEVRFEPLDSATVHYSLYEGMKVRIIDQNRAWTKIMRSDGKKGWVMSVTLQKI